MVLLHPPSNTYSSPLAQPSTEANGLTLPRLISAPDAPPALSASVQTLGPSNSAFRNAVMCEVLLHGQSSMPGYA
jgi:hypothetical protein